jgi:hypothetical protein
MIMAQCVTCGTELHPERARKYDYCTAPACQKENFKGLTMVAVGMNKAADELMILDEQTREDMASGKFRDQRRGTFGQAEGQAGSTPSAASAPRAQAAGDVASDAQPSSAQRAEAARKAGSTSPGASGSRSGVQGSAGSKAPAASAARAEARPDNARPAARRSARPPWTKSQERLARLYNEQGLRPEEIAAKLGISRYLATQIVLAARNRG